MSYPKARTILINGAVRKGERLIPPSSFEILLRVTFPASSARVKVGIVKETASAIYVENNMPTFTFFLLTFCVIFLQATERFEAIYPTLKEVALAGSPGSKAMKQVSQQIFSFAAKAAGESMIILILNFFYP